jgi:spore coat protein CotH
LAYELGLKTGHWTPRVKFCEVLLNGQNVGLYNLIEKIGRDSSRINIGKLTETEISGTDLTGGYVLKYDKPNGTLQIVYPKEKNLQPEQEEYIFNFVKNYDDVLKTNNGLDEDLGYKKYIDPQSLIDYMVVVELTKNCDSYLYSTYLYKDKDDRDGRIKFGPLWDFDLSIGNSVWQEGYKNEGWQFEYPGNNKFNIKRLLQDPEMVELFQERWLELRDKFLHTDSLFARIDDLRAELKEPLKRNYEVWPLVDKGIFFPAYYVNSYDEEIEYMKNWLAVRVAWIDEHIKNIYYPVTVYTDIDDSQTQTASEFSAHAYPNPFAHEFYIDLNVPNSGNLQIEIINVQGKVVDVIESTPVEKGEYKVYWNKGNTELWPGLHIVSIKIDGKLFEHIKVLYKEEN